MWEKSTLGASCKMYQPKTISAKKMVADGKYVVFGANGIIGKHNDYNHAKPQLLITCRGATCGAVNVSEPFSWINGNAMVIQPDLDRISLKYMEYFFRGGVDLSKAITGAAQPQITRQSLEPIEFSYPSLAEQQRIVAKLDAAFAAIDEAIKLSMNKAFEIGELKSALLSIILNRKDWSCVEKKLTDIATVSTGKWDANHSTEGGKYRFYTCAAKHLYSDTRRFSGECLILPGNGANVGDVYYYDGDFDAYQRTYVIHDIKILPRFLNYHMQLNWKKINENKQFGSATNFIKIGNFKDYTVAFPSSVEQQNIVRKLDAAFVELEAAKSLISENLENFSALKSAILAQELQGETP